MYRTKNTGRPSMDRGGNKIKSQSQALTNAQVDLKIQRALKKNIEEKVTYRTASSNIDYSGTTYSLQNSIARADGDIDAFTGDVIHPTRLVVRFNLECPVSYNLMRIVILQWNDSAACIPSGVFQTTGNADAVLGPLRWENRNLMRVHYDRLFKVKPTAVDWNGGSETVAVFGTITLERFSPVSFASTTTAPMNIQKGGLFLACISDDAAVSYPSINFSSELIYSDA